MASENNLIIRNFLMGVAMAVFGLGCLHSLGQTDAVDTQPPLSTDVFTGIADIRTDPVMTERVSLLEQRFDPFIKTALVRLKEGDYLRAQQLYQRVLSMVEEPSFLQSYLEGLPQQIETEANERIQRYNYPADLGQWRGFSLTKTAIGSLHFLVYSDYMMQAYFGLVHLLYQEGKYAQAISKAQEAEEAYKKYSVWQYQIAGKTYAQPSADAVLYPLHWCLRGYTLGGCYRVSLDIALSYYRLHDYDKAREWFIRSQSSPNVMGVLGVYAHRLQLRGQQTGYKEVGALVLLGESANVLGNMDCPARGVPDVRSTANWESALKYAEEAYRLMPNNLDVCQ
jgi:tetratricopeptide (TPR) repeat protein